MILCILNFNWCGLNPLCLNKSVAFGRLLPFFKWDLNWKDQDFYFCQGRRDRVQCFPTWCNILKVQCFPDPIIWRQRMTTQSQIKGTISRPRTISTDTWWRHLVSVCHDIGYCHHIEMNTLSSFWNQNDAIERLRLMLVVVSCSPQHSDSFLV